MMRRHTAILIGMICLIFSREGLAQEAQSKSSENSVSTLISVPEATFPGDQSVVWEKLLEVLKAHDLPIATSDKSAGTLTTGPKRYFKISSAKFPPVEQDYRDTYTINVAATGSSTRIQIQRKFEIYDTGAKNWMDGDPVKEKVGIGAENLFNALTVRLAETTPP